MEALSWGWANHAQENGKMLLVGMGRALHLAVTSREVFRPDLVFLRLGEGWV